MAASRVGLRPALRSPVASTAQKLPAVPVAAACALAIFFYFFPLFRVVPLQIKTTPGSSPSTSDSSAAFDPTTFTEKFWPDRLAPAAARATEATALLSSLRRDPALAAKQFAHQAGIGGSGYYFLRGTGRVTAIERNRVLLELAGATIALGTGPVFGNTVRDGTGLLNVNDCPGLAEFNALSAALNARVEKEILPALRARAQVGATLAFAGCAEAPESLDDAGPLLRVVPVSVEAAK